MEHIKDSIDISNSELNSKSDMDTLKNNFVSVDNSSESTKEVLTTYNPTKPVIATMTLISKINANINLLNFSKYLNLSPDSIIYIKYNKNNDLIERSIDMIKVNKNKKKPKKYFYNQCTIIMNCGNNSKVNLKLFLNGKIQMTGCKSLENATTALEKLSNELRKEKYILSEDNELIKQELVDNTDFVMDPPQVALINSVFQTGICINRDKLHQILITKYNIQATFQPIIYVGINSKFVASSGTKVSILIFQTGKIIITAAKNMSDINESYEFIKKVFSENKDLILR